jgi:nucleotide-binding universal stress UspA family protein
MNNLRSILLHVDASPRSAVRLQLARELGSQHEATVTALYGVTPTFLALPFAFAEGTPGVLPMIEEIDADRRRATRAEFDRQQRTGATAMRWADLGNEPVTQGFTAQALVTDLMVLGQRDANDPLAEGVPPDFVESVLIASGKPALIVPYAGAFTSVGRDVLVAWKPTREAARAVAEALPLLQRARNVHVVGWTADNSDGSSGRIDLAGYLRSHGVEAKVQVHSAAPVEVGESLLSLAADVGADLLVMGCYGHSRARELVLGGATRTILRSMTLPVLMAH